MIISRFINKKIWHSLLGLTVLCLCCAVIFRHIQTDRLAVPWMDGSQHFSNAANLMNLLISGEISAHWSFVQGLFPLLSVYVLYIFSFVLTAGKSFYSLGFLFSLLFIFLIFNYLRNCSTGRDAVKKAAVFTILVFSSGLLFSENGGFLDTRIDAVSVLFGAVSLLAAVRSLYYQAFLFCAAASLLKGAAFFLIFPQILLIGFFIEWKAGIGSFLMRHFSERKIHVSTITKYTVLLFMFFAFFRYSFLDSLSYNLMKTGGAGLTERMLIFQKTMTQYLSGGIPFYLNHLFRNSGTVHLAILASSVYAYMKIRKQEISFLDIFLPLVSFLFSLLIMSSNPLASGLLLIWFFPSACLLNSFFAELSARISEKKWILIIIPFLVYPAVKKMKLKYEIKESYLASARDTIHFQSEKTAEILDIYARKKKFLNAVVFSNFLTKHGVISHDYNAYRSLILSKMKQENVFLEGWELSTYSEDWRKELEAFKGKDVFVFLLQENPEAVPSGHTPNIHGKNNYKTIMDIASKNTACFKRPFENRKINPMGNSVVLVVEPSEECSKIISAASG